MTAGFDVGAERPVRPTIAQLRAVTQPPSVRTRAAAEHWVAHAYLRDVSPYLTRILLRAGFSANGVTWLDVARRRCVATDRRLWGDFALLGRCSAAGLLDGEVARGEKSSPSGGNIFGGNYVAECGLPLLGRPAR